MSLLAAGSSAQLAPEVSVLALSLGLVFGLACYLVTNLSPGGMITPGWLALVLITDPTFALIIGGVAVATYFASRLVQRVVILYGKRLFATVVLIGVFIQLTIFVLVSRTLATSADYTTLGFIIPGLVAYQLIRQPVGATLLATGAVAALNYVIVLAGVQLRLIRSESPGSLSAEGLTGGSGLETGPVQLIVAVVALVAGLVLLLRSMRRVRRRSAVDVRADGANQTS